MSADLFVRKITPEENIEFDCDDDDLTDFFRSDCQNYQREMLAVTYEI